jgi:DNA-binding FadR family transcriptional regulator
MLPFVLSGNSKIFKAISARKAQQARSAALAVIEEARLIIKSALKEYAKSDNSERTISNKRARAI